MSTRGFAQPRPSWDEDGRHLAGREHGDAAIPVRPTVILHQNIEQLKPTPSNHPNAGGGLELLGFELNKRDRPKSHDSSLHFERAMNHPDGCRWTSIVSEMPLCQTNYATETRILQTSQCVKLNDQSRTNTCKKGKTMMMDMAHPGIKPDIEASFDGCGWGYMKGLNKKGQTTLEENDRHRDNEWYHDDKRGVRMTMEEFDETKKEIVKKGLVIGIFANGRYLPR